MTSDTRPPKTAMIVARRIVRDIDRLSLRPGDKLPAERKMLEEYQVGRGTLRESLRFLELQGIISLKPGPGGGPIVEQPEAGNLATLVALLLQFADAPYRVVAEVRVALEPMMARLAAERISPDAVAELSGTVTAMEEGISEQETFLDANKRFHDVIAWSSGNALFGYLVDALADILDGTMLGIDYPPHRRTAILKAHRRILDAIASGDAAAAQGAMADHIGEYVRYAERKFPDVLTRRVVWQT
jgi:GntR family transcriptional regulator, transcriptional repressor for pyruvate dehydrogenase complex